MPPNMNGVASSKMALSQITPKVARLDSWSGDAAEGQSRSLC